jgi:hypothetical protein
MTGIIQSCMLSVLLFSLIIDISGQGIRQCGYAESKVEKIHVINFIL